MRIVSLEPVRGRLTSPSSADGLHGDQHPALKEMFWLALPASQRPLLDKPPMPEAMENCSDQ